jgi:hypothetical protein
MTAKEIFNTVATVRNAEVLRELAQSVDPFKRLLVAINPYAPEDIRHILKEDEVAFVRKAEGLRGKIFYGNRLIKGGLEGIIESVDEGYRPALHKLVEDLNTIDLRSGGETGRLTIYLR